MLKGQTALITGGSRGIGAAIAKKFASMGADIAIIYAGSQDEAEVTVREITGSYSVKAQAYLCDVSDYEATKECVNTIKKDFGSIHILVNNAGITRDSLLMTMKEENYDAVLNVNLKGAFNMIRHCIGIFVRNKGGRIINISSVAGMMGNAGQVNYAASKAGLIGMTKSVAREYASRGITCNAIAPGFIETAMTEKLDADQNTLLAGIPLGRMGSVEDVANAAAYLAEAGYVTGDVLRVDGGIAM